MDAGPFGGSAVSSSLASVFREETEEAFQTDSRQIAQEKGFPQILSHIEGQRGCAIIGNDCKLFKHKRDYNLKTSWSTIPPLYKDILAMPLVTALSRWR